MAAMASAPHSPPLAAYAARYARQGLESRFLHRRPIFLTVFVTARCALNCGHCFYREELKNGKVEEEFTLDEYDRFTSKLPSFPKLILTGGEPFLRPDLVDIAELFYSNASAARQITIPTAGSQPERIVALAETLLGKHNDLILEIQLSIDGVGAQHDSIRGKGAFDRLMRTYEALRPIQDRNEGLRIRFNYTFSRVTQDWFEGTWQHVTQTLGNPHFDMVLVRRATIEDAYWGQVDVEKYRRATQLLQESERKKAAGSTLKELLAERVQVEREIIAEHHQGKRVMDNCMAGTLTAIVSEKGEVRPCEILDTCFGNVRDTDYDMMALWNNEIAQEHRRHIKSTGCFCTFETCVRTTMVFQPKWYAKMAGNYVGSKLGG